MIHKQIKEVWATVWFDLIRWLTGEILGVWGIFTTPALGPL